MRDARTQACILRETMGGAYLTCPSREHPRKGPRLLTFIHIGSPVSWATLMTLTGGEEEVEKEEGKGKKDRRSFPTVQSNFSQGVSQVRERLHRANYASP